MYLLAFPLSAVLPLPNRSYDTPVRIDQSFQLGTPSIAAKLRAWIHGPAGDDSAGTSALKWSKRAPRFRVIRFIVHVSCTYVPRSLLTFCSAVVGPLATATAIGLPPLNTSVLICAFDEKVRE